MESTFPDSIPRIAQPVTGQPRRLAWCAACWAACWTACWETAIPAAQPASTQSEAAHHEYKTQILAGKVAWAAEAIERRHGIRVDPAAADRVLVLELPDGELLPILEDTRGRAFRDDPPLMGRELRLLVRRHEKLPMLQVLRVFAVGKEGVVEIDYWCATCAISLVHRAPCDCCQGSVERRERPIEGDIRSLLDSDG